MIENLRNTQFPDLIHRKSIISGLGVGASVASDIAFGHYYDTYTPFGSTVLVGNGYMGGTLTHRRTEPDAMETYNVSTF
jgi:hypothetical protein